MLKVLCSTGALLKYGGDYKVLETLSKKLQCDGYEFMVDSPYYEEAESLKRFLRKIKLCIPVVHCEKSIGEKISIGSPSFGSGIRIFSLHLTRRWQRSMDNWTYCTKQNTNGCGRKVIYVIIM